MTDLEKQQLEIAIGALNFAMMIFSDLGFEIGTIDIHKTKEKTCAQTAK